MDDTSIVIRDIVCDYFSIHPDRFLKKRTDKHISLILHIVGYFYFIYYTPKDFAELSAFLNRDRTFIYYSWNLIQDYCDVDKQVFILKNNIHNKIKKSIDKQDRTIFQS